MNFNLIKKLLAFFAVGVWVVLIYNIFQSGGGMNDQMPQCIFTTISIFAILNLLIKAIEHKENLDNKESNTKI